MKIFLLHLSIFVLLVLKSMGQEQHLVKDQGITSALHKEQVGKIAFTSRIISLPDLKKEDFLNSYEFTNKSNLFITVFMDKSLTNYLSQLAPGIKADSLVKIGNYHFSFFIDDRLIYESSLHPGAPYPEIKNTETVLVKPLINNQAPGRWWSQSLWERFMTNGGDSALTEGKHILKMDIKPYINANVLKKGNLIASGKITLQVKRKPVIDIKLITLDDARPYKEISVSHENFNRNKIKELKGNINEGIFKNITSIVVLKNGKLLIEEYFNGADRNTQHDVRSVGKSFASTLTGIAQESGYLKDENMALKDFYDMNTFQNYSSQKELITIKDLLTMSSAFTGNDEDMNSPGNEEYMYPTPNWLKFTLDLPVDSTKKKGEWQYFTAGIVLLGDILDKAVPEGLEKFADKQLFQPLHITNYKWQYTPQKVANTAGGLQMNALDFAKYGQLYKNKGAWEGKKIIPQEWVSKTFTKHKPIPERENEYYGYLFWNKSYLINGTPHETYYCAGNGGNKIFVFKDQPLVIVITATAYGTSYAHRQVDKIMEEYILPSVLVEKK